MKKLKKWIIYTLLAIIAIIFLSDWYVSSFSEKYIYKSIETIPKKEVGVLLGTSKKLKSGAKNFFFSYRIEAAAQLYHAGKIKLILVSGDNSNENYNEPKDMRDALVARGIPSEKIILDYAGFSTYESIVRAEKVFDLTSYTLISQEFHIQRGIFIGQKRNHDIIGFPAKDVIAYGGFLTKMREKLARVKVLYDVWFEPEPTFLGDKVKIR